MTPLKNARNIALWLAFGLMPLWLKWPFAPPAFSRTYAIGFVVTLPLIVVGLLWWSSGFAGWRHWFRTRWHLMTGSGLLFLLLWMMLSASWAFGADDYPGLAPNMILQQMVVTGFVLAIVATTPPPRTIVMVLVASLVLHGLIGLAQVIAQSSVGLSWLGEFALNPAESGVSVIQSGAMRWLRPHGLLPHPNIYAGILVIGVLATAGWLLTAARHRWLATGIFIFGFYTLLLTFSRGAWLGFGVGVLFALPFVWRRAGFWRRMIPAMVGAVVVGVLFVMLHAPLLLARAGVGAENTELRSIADRIVYTEIAQDAISTYPVQGIGAGNFIWYAADYLFFRTNYDLRGNPVHNIYLLVTAELGLVGAVLLGVIVIGGIGAALQKPDPLRISLLAGFIAWGVIGLVDHYMWTQIGMQSMWFGLLAVAMASPSQPASGAAPESGLKSVD